MAFLDSAIKIVAPGFALRREVSRRRLDRLNNFKEKSGGSRSFDAISGGRLRYDFLAPKNSPDSALDGADALRLHVRQLEYNNGFVAGPVKRIARNVVNTGIRFQSRVVADDNNYLPFPKISEEMANCFNFQMERAVKKWMKQADKRLISNFFGLQKLISMAFERDGEVIAVNRESARRGRLIPVCIELFEIDRLQTPMEEFNNPSIRNGIRYDSEGVPKSCFLLKRHPGEAVLMAKGADFDEISIWNPNGTKKVMHLFDPTRPEQTRGFSPFAAGLKDYQDLDRYREAEIYARLEDACLTGFVKTTSPADFQAGYTVGNTGGDGGDGESRRIHEFAPGQMNYLEPDEDIEIHEPKRANSNLDNFVNHLLRGPANALDIPPEVLSQDWQGMNYSNARTVLLQFYSACRVRQRFIVENFCEPVYENVALSLIAKGIVQAPGFATRREDYLRHAWVLPGWSWVDPIKEAKGKEIEVNNNFETITDVCAAKGNDAEETLETRARELKKIQDLEVKYGVKFPSGQTEAPNDTNQDEENESGPARMIRRIK